MEHLTQRFGGCPQFLLVDADGSVGRAGTVIHFPLSMSGKPVVPRATIKMDSVMPAGNLRVSQSCAETREAFR